MRLLLFCTVLVAFTSVVTYFLARGVVWKQSRMRSWLSAALALGWPCLVLWLLDWLPHTALSRDLMLAAATTVALVGSLVVWHHESQR